MATYFDKFNDLLSKADNASALARTKVIGRLMWIQRNGLNDIINSLFGAGIASIALSFLMILLAQSMGLSEGLALVCLLGIWAVNMGAAVVAHLKCKKYEQHAENAGVFINFKANRKPSASFKMRVVDAYETWEFPQPQLEQLKALAQRNDIPQGWWESACNLINDYREHCLRAERLQKHQEGERRAEQRLANLSVVSVAPEIIVQSPTDAVPSDPSRLLV